MCGRVVAGAVLWMLLPSCSPFEEGTHKMSEQRAFVVQAESAATVAGMSVSAQINADESGKDWKVKIVFMRPDGAPPMHGSDVEVELLDSHGGRLKRLEGPRGDLIEVGGSLGNSVNADFVFGTSDAHPSKLLVGYQGQSAAFTITGRS